MDERVKKIDTPEKCEIFTKNALAKGSLELANQARERAVQLKAEQYGANTQVEKEALEAVYAYEAARSQINGKKTRATRTWQMIAKRGIIESVERAVNRPVETQGYKALAEMGLEDYAFEAVILRHPDAFSAESLAIAKERLSDLEKGKA